MDKEAWRERRFVRRRRNNAKNCFTSIFVFLIICQKNHGCFGDLKNTTYSWCEFQTLCSGGSVGKFDAFLNFCLFWVIFWGLGNLGFGGIPPEIANINTEKLASWHVQIILSTLEIDSFRCCHRNDGYTAVIFPLSGDAVVHVRWQMPCKKGWAHYENAKTWYENANK